MSDERRRAEATLDARSPLADPASRVLAQIVDTLAPFAPLLLLGPVGVAAREPMIIRAGLWSTLVAAIALLAVDAWWLHRYGQTLGKRLIGLRIVCADGARASLGRIFWRRIVLSGLLGAVPALGWLFALADALFIFSATRQTLHDRIAGTIVVDLRREAPVDIEAVAEELG